jgi:signal transduction histidine kinase
MDLHDGLIQELYGLGLKVEDATEVAPEDPDAAVAWLGNVQVALREAITEIRTYVYGLKETDRSVELRPVLEHLIAEFPAAHPQIELWVERDARLPAAVAANVVHIVREAVANSLRHSGASRVGVRVASKDSRLVVAVGDDGTGFEPNAPVGGLGIAHMRERARLCRSELTIVSSPGGGTNVVITLPSEMAPPDASADRS